MAKLIKVLMSTALSMQDLVFAPQLRTAPEGGSYPCLCQHGEILNSISQITWLTSLIERENAI